jgi:hypothetical protein
MNRRGFLGALGAILGAAAIPFAKLPARMPRARANKIVIVPFQTLTMMEAGAAFGPGTLLGDDGNGRVIPVSNRQRSQAIAQAMDRSDGTGLVRCRII